MKVLIVDPDAQRVPPLQQALAAAGAEVALASSGSFALTMLEWNRQDVIVSRPVIGDMDAIELCSIVRADPATREVRFVLVAGAGEIETDRTAAAGVDLVLPTDMTAAMILTLVSLMRRERERQKTPVAAGQVPRAVEVPAPSTSPSNGMPRVVTPATEPLPVNGAPHPAVLSPAPPAALSSAALVEGLGRGEARTLQGSLGIMRIEEITQALAAGGKTGRLILAVGGSGGLVVFDRGAPVHAEYREGTGEPALAAMIVTARRERAGRFCFIPGDPVATAAPRTIDRTLSEVLVDIAPAGDDGEAAASRQPGER